MHPDKIIENQILDEIKQKRPCAATFEDLINGFKKKLDDFNPTDNCFEIEKYFGEGMGKAGAVRKMLADGKINPEWLKDKNNDEVEIKNDFKGLYVFIHDKTPIYVGISKGVIGRILQHTKGHSHYSASLAYQIGKIRYNASNPEAYTGGRKDFDFRTQVAPVKEFLMKQKIAFLPINNNEELYLFEIYVAMELKTWLNNFETH